MRILVVSGSTRALSTNATFCRSAAHCAPPGVTVEALADCALADLAAHAVGSGRAG